MMMPDDPWKGIKTPESLQSISARRVNAEVPWNFFWAKDSDGRCLLVLKHSADSMTTGKLPELRGLEVVDSESEESSGFLLRLTLIETAHRDIFHHLCLDIVRTASSATTENEAVSKTLARTWRWHYLLRGGIHSRLSTQEQKGLIGELLVFERLLLPTVGGASALAAWLGPTGAPKDFEIGRVGIESKARRGGAEPFVSISSEYQLDEEGSDALFLYVVELDRASEESPVGLSISDYANRIRGSLSTDFPAGVEVFEGLLAAAGFNWDNDYSSEKWIEGPTHLFRVDDSFPHIAASEVPIGISRVRYSLALIACEPFRVEADDIIAELSGGTRDAN